MTHSLRVTTIVLAVSVGFFGSVKTSSGQTPSEAKQVFSGSGLFQTYCVVCHGADAKGTGPLANSMKKRPTDLTKLAQKNGGTFPAEITARIIDGNNPVKGHGGGDMPVWSDALLRSQDGGSPAIVQERIAELVSYIKSIQAQQ